MNPTDQQSGIDWTQGGIPVARRFDDPYYSLENGLEEARHVFLQGNDLPQRLVDGFHVAELGFGTGLNFLALWRAWRETGRRGRVTFTSFEAYPMQTADMARALAAFPELGEQAGQMLAALAAEPDGFETDDIVLRIIRGDANRTLAAWDGMADAWFLDGFAPAKNPDLWQATLLHAVARHTAPGGTFATYTAAGQIRRDLAAAGFRVERVAGFGRKRHMTRGRLGSAA